MKTEEIKCVNECISKGELTNARKMIEELEKQKSSELEVIKNHLEQVKGMKEMLFALENGAFKEKEKEVKVEKMEENKQSN